MSLICNLDFFQIHLLQVSNNNTPSKTLDFSSEDFDSRWESFKPNTIVKTDNQINSDLLSVEKITDISSISSNEYQDTKKSPSLTNLHGSFENVSKISKSLSNENVSSRKNLDKNISKSSENLDSWLQNVAMDTKDMSYVQNLSQAINDLDNALASEPTSSSSVSAENWESRKLDFKIGEPIGKNIIGKNLDEPNSLMDSLCYAKNESGSETEDETWKRRIERGKFDLINRSIFKPAPL